MAVKSPEELPKTCDIIQEVEYLLMDALAASLTATQH